MKPFKKILFVAAECKGTRSAWNRAVQFAVANNARMTLFDTVAVEDLGIYEQDISSTLGSMQNARLEHRRKALQAMRDAAVSKNPGLRLTIDVRKGDLAMEATRAVITRGYDLLIKAAEGAYGRRSVLFGSSDQRLIRKCPCPVWILKQSRRRTIRRILAAVDVGRNEMEASNLAHQIMALSTALAKDNDSELHVLYAWQFKHEAQLRGGTVAGSVIASLNHELAEANKRQFDRLLQRFKYEKMTVRLIKGDANHVIPEYTEENAIDLVVMGTVGRSGIAGLIIGNTAESVLQAVDCSVLMLKPEGFESLVEV